MQPMHLRHDRRYCLGYCSEMKTEVAGNIGYPSLEKCEVDSSSASQVCWGKALRWLQVRVAHVLICPRSSPGGTGGYFADTSAAYKSQALLIFRFADVLVRSSFHCIFKKLSSKVFIQKKLLILNSERSKRNFQSHSFSTSFSANYHVNLTEPIFLTDEYMKRTQVIFSSANPCIQTVFIIGVFL